MSIRLCLVRLSDGRVLVGCGEVVLSCWLLLVGLVGKGRVTPSPALIGSGGLVGNNWSSTSWPFISTFKTQTHMTQNSIQSRKFIHEKNWRKLKKSRCYFISPDFLPLIGLTSQYLPIQNMKQRVFFFLRKMKLCDPNIQKFGINKVSWSVWLLYICLCVFMWCLLIPVAVVTHVWGWGRAPVQ